MLELAIRKLYSRAETAHALGCSERTVARMLQDERLQAVRIGRRSLIHIDEITRISRTGW